MGLTVILPKFPRRKVSAKMRSSFPRPWIVRATVECHLRELLALRLAVFQRLVRPSHRQNRNHAPASREIQYRSNLILVEPADPASPKPQFRRRQNNMLARNGDIDCRQIHRKKRAREFARQWRLGAQYNQARRFRHPWLVERNPCRRRTRNRTYLRLIANNHETPRLRVRATRREPARLQNDRQVGVI